MRLWGYYAWHTFWNTIKKMFRSTFLVIILAIFGFGIIFGLIGGVVGSMVEKQQSLETVESSSEADRVQEETMEEEETQKTPQEIAAIKTYVEAGVMIVFLAILLWGMYSGSKDGTDIFQMADVNLLFTAPMKPQSVLMFRLSFQMVATVFASIYLVFQIPNLVVNYEPFKIDIPKINKEIIPISIGGIGSCSHFCRGDSASGVSETYDCIDIYGLHHTRKIKTICVSFDRGNCCTAWNDCRRNISGEWAEPA